jgi:hypothetical protein
VTPYLSLLFLSSDQVVDFVSLSLSSVVSTESSSGNLDGLLLLRGDTSTDHFHHLFLVGGETGDFTDDLPDESDSLAEGSLSAGSLSFLGAHLRLSDDEALVQANEDSTSALHLSIFN